MVKLSEIVSQEEGYYFITYRSHPNSNEDFSYINRFIYAQSSHEAHLFLKSHQKDIDDPAVSEYDLGVGMIVPVNHLVQQDIEVETLEELRELDTQKVIDLLESKRPVVSEKDVLEVGKRQERIERDRMGEDVDDIISVDKN
jgi:hypothetical protein